MEDSSSNMPDAFDRLMGALDGLPDVLRTSASTVQTLTPLLGNSETWIVQTVRQAEQGDVVFLQRVNREGSIRIALPAKVANVIARQRDALTTKARRKAAKAAVETRKEKGIVPFQKKAGDAAS